MTAKQKRTLIKKSGNKIFRSINKSFAKFHKLLETSVFLKKSHSKKHIYMNPEINKMNKIMRLFFKHKELEFKINDNLIPIKFKTSDNITISALKYITDHNSKKWVIVSHWFLGDKYWSLYWSKAFIELGYNVLVYDFRNHGDSEETPFVTMGLLESKDLIAAINYLNQTQKVQTIGLLGLSMGAFVINYLTLTQQKFLEENKVKFIVSDSSYASISSLLNKLLKLSFKRFFSKKYDIYLIKQILKKQKDLTLSDWNKMNLFDKYEKQHIIPAKIPILFIHSIEDRITSHNDSIRMFINRKKFNLNDELLIYETSKHCLSLKEHYYQTIYRILQFENKIIKDNNKTSIALEKMGIIDKIILNNFNEKKEISTFFYKD
ncbi:alpha/beta hydrolase [Mycoplasma mycoides]|uniref:alpha/beta hydrolase n=1 Tax=Mycoplasma mycoides TaxID=2102 RepID=UPI002734BAD5|nr:alpha/beta fold hydrolase [Mycoplasma mycoides]MDP4040828.1 alpha/beta fold hydrolase [Mycoplasma mycoides]MDP4041689.1 alpha/beta fold hydrolase [Mycoplasma mycoides]MDP4042589.1 alpha/beta fold hydrolase [Mycoplasma mycoides]MDP4044063.1 alpha/beta fold hydrolase [Mycoplasma mycoides]MDP4044934.1 alpha/beta fold hydrolase [Mycoplasma mycoides]